MDVKEYVYGTFDGGRRLLADVYYKPATNDVAKDTRPIALLIYGGAFVAGTKATVSKARLDSLIHEFGFTVVVPDYRHCPGISVYDGPVTDIHSAYLWACRELPELLFRDVGASVDGNRVAVIGSSAGGNLALHLGSATPPPRAIVSYFPAIYLKDPFWHSPMEVMAQIPRFPEAFVNKIYNEGVITSAPPSFKKVPDSPKPVPDFTKPRTAWLLSNLRDGTMFQNVVQDGNYERVDPVELFSTNFPPTCFIHGTEDKMALPRFSAQAYQTLQSLGVDAKLIVANGYGHDFETSMPADHPDFSIIRESHRFAADRV
ncbi:alpha beta-hydrolase [Fusarium beomiforme]|uniref:Alpha beta-hydrolase n=1 Tax=Fusarium beomiforme TaxID=44412 RepID=A0A9P5DQ90_9HYPO|nr:alpha beta-hydrolase [Fusarium beomiforme]